MKKSNIKRISELAGVSTTAVSFVLNNRPGVSEKTRENILRIIAEENYTPNVNSRRLILRRSFNIMVVIDPICSLDNLFYSTILQSIIAGGEALGYHVVISTYRPEFRSSSAAAAIQQKNVDGAIFLSDISEEAHAYLSESAVPFVVVDSHRASPGYPTVRSDYHASAETAARFLISCGHKKIAFMGYGNRPDYYLETFGGFRDIMEAHGLVIRPEWVFADPIDAETARLAMQRLLALPERPTALLCACDMFALVGMNCAQQSGLRIPEDLSFCGIDDIVYAQFAVPPLTTVWIDSQEMGRQAVSLLNELIEKTDGAVSRLVRSDKLIRRQSVAVLT